MSTPVFNTGQEQVRAARLQARRQEAWGGVCAWLVSASGGLVLVGWALNWPGLKTLLLGSVAMSPLTGAAFVASGTSLWILRREHASLPSVRVARVIAASVALLGLYSLLGYLSHGAVGPFLLPGSGLVPEPGAWTMAPNSALNFLLCGLALLMLDVENARGWRPAQWLLLIVLLVGLLAIIAHIYQVMELFGVGTHNPMAPHTALTFLLFCVGALAVRGQRGLMAVFTSDSMGGILARRLLPAAVLIPMFIGAVHLWGEKARLYPMEAGVALFAAASLILFAALIWWTACLVYRMDLENKRAAAALRDSEALYRSLVDTLPVNVLRKDLHGRISFANKRYCASMGASLDKLLGKTDYDLFPAEMAEKYVSDDRKVLQSEQVFEDVEAHQSPDGKRSYMHVLKAPVFDAQGEVIGTQVIFWDVTPRKEAEEALARTAADLARSNRELEQFAYVASHDLQEPLRMIASYTQLLARRYEDKLDQDAKEFIGYAVEGARRMQRLINELLAYSRLGTRGKPFERVACDQVLKATLANLQIAIEESGAVITADPLPAVYGDSVQLIQLFQNLLSNAIKFRGQEPPRIHIGVERQAEPDGALPANPAAAEPRQAAEQWVLHVRDNGIGIDPRYFERIFAIFTRLHTREEYPGTGIGLAVCKKIIERHGGRIWVSSEPGQGATFSFTLPVLAAA